MAESIRDILDDWKIKLGGRVPIRDARMQPMLDLFAMFAHHGYTREDFASESVKNEIIKTCIPFNAKAKKKPGWAAAVKADITTAIFTQWPMESVKSDKVIVTPPPIVAEVTSPIQDEPFQRTTKDPDPEFLASLPEPNSEYDDEEFSRLLRGVK